MRDYKKILSFITTLHAPVRNTLLFTTFLFSTNLQAELREVTTSAKAVISGSITYDQAKSHVLHQARTKAVEQAAGINISSTSIIQNNLMLVDLVKTFSYGFIVNEQNLRWTGGWIDNNQKELGFPLIEVSLTSTVKILPKSFFRNNILTASLNKKMFMHGEKATIAIKARKNCYIIIANYTSKNKIIPIFPNQVTKDNLLLENQKITIPKEDSGFDILVSNYKDHKTDSEAFIIMGFEKNQHTDLIDWKQILTPNIEIDYAEFFNRIVSLPIDSLAEKTLLYQVNRK